MDMIFFGATQTSALGHLASLRGAIQPAGAIWVIRPKGQKSITEADTMAAGKRAGLVDVKVVSFSDSHTAEKFVIPVANRPAATPAKRRSGGPVRRLAGSSVQIANGAGSAVHRIQPRLAACAVDSHKEKLARLFRHAACEGRGHG